MSQSSRSSLSEAHYFPAHDWLPRLLEGWRLPYVVGLAGHHLNYSILLWRPL